MILYGPTQISKLSAKEVFQAILEFGFQVNPYPIIVHLEVHNTTAQRFILQDNIEKTLGSSLYKIPYNYDEMKYYPSPNDLQYRVLVSGRIWSDQLEEKFTEQREHSPQNKDYDKAEDIDREMTQFC